MLVREGMITIVEHKVTKRKTNEINIWGVVGGRVEECAHEFVYAFIHNKYVKEHIAPYMQKFMV